MVKLLIADDEPFIRQGIRYAINWEENDIEVVGEAANGEEALKMAIRLAPDIILADIQMPILNGLDLAKKMNELLPRTKVIILTAYGNTENFTNAIEVQVSAFLLKSADSKKILDTVLKIKKELALDNKNSLYNELLENVYKDNQHLIKSNLFARYFNNKLSYDNFLIKLEKLNLSLPGPFFSMILARCASNDSFLTIDSFFRAFSRYNPFVFFVNNTDIVVVFSSNESGINPDEMTSLLSDIQPYVFGNFIALINSIESIEQFPVSYFILNKTLDSCFWNITSDYTLVDLNATFRDADLSDLYNFESKVISAILSKNNLEIEKSFENYFIFMQTVVISREIFLESIKRIVILIKSISEQHESIDTLFEVINETETPEKIIDLVLSLVKPVNEIESKNSQIPVVLNYIDKHYASDLKLSDAARAAHISSGYLSRIFKVETGYSFKEWLNRVRIDKAKQLIINSDLKYYEIAEKVGYNDYKYFSAYFNKFCGCSAKEYKYLQSNLD